MQSRLTGDIIFGWPAVLRTDREDIPIPLIVYEDEVGVKVEVDGEELLRRMYAAGMKHEEGYGPCSPD